MPGFSEHEDLTRDEMTLRIRCCRLRGGASISLRSSTASTFFFKYIGFELSDFFSTYISSSSRGHSYKIFKPHSISWCFPSHMHMIEGATAFV